MFALGSCLCLLHWIKFSDSPRGSRSMACTMSTNCLEVQGQGTSYVLLFCKMGFTPSSKGLCGNPQLLREVTAGTTGSSGGTCPVCTQWTFSLINRFSFVGLFLLNLLITMLQTYLDFGISYFILVPFQSFWMFFFFFPLQFIFFLKLAQFKTFLWWTCISTPGWSLPLFWFWFCPSWTWDCHIDTTLSLYHSSC